MSDLSEFEIQYRGSFLAQMLMTQALLKEVIKMKGEDGAAWIADFERTQQSEVDKVQITGGGASSPQINVVAKSVIANVAKMARERSV